MKLICNFCDFSREKPLPLDILRVVTQPDMPHEDTDLWIGRLWLTYGFKEFRGLKSHRWRMHKDQMRPDLMPIHEYSKEETEIIEAAIEKLATATN